MMTADALLSLITLVAFVCLFYGPWQAACTDYARQLIFEKRDELFDLAYNGKLEFSSPQYRVIRSSLEAMIRFAHELTWPNFAMLYNHARLNANNSKFTPTVSKAIDEIEDQEIREKVKHLVQESAVALIVMAIFKSILFLPFLLVFFVIQFCGYRIPDLVRKNRMIKRMVEAVQASAEHASA
jgi:hypothetical protein